jgi:hypothetical protein
MSSILKFKKHYLVFASILFIIEILIALFVHDRIVRPYIGDFLVVILIYCFLRSFINISILTASISVLIFSYFIEVLQHFNIVNRLGLESSGLARIVIGTSFEWIDLIAYTSGIIAVLYVEKIMAGKTSLKPGVITF